MSKVRFFVCFSSLFFSFFGGGLQAGILADSSDYQSIRLAMSQGLDEVSLRKIKSLQKNSEIWDKLSTDEQKEIAEVEGELLVRTGAWLDGIEKIRSVSAPTARSQYWKGVALSRLGRSSEAEKELSQVNLSQVNETLNDDIRQAAAEELIKIWGDTKEEEKALALLRGKGWKLNPQWAFLRTGQILINQGAWDRLEESASALESALQAVERLRNLELYADKESGLSPELLRLRARLLPHALVRGGRWNEAVTGYADFIENKGADDERAKLLKELKEAVFTHEIGSEAKESLMNRLSGWAKNEESIALSNEALLFQAQLIRHQLDPERESFDADLAIALELLGQLESQEDRLFILAEANFERAVIDLNFGDEEGKEVAMERLAILSQEEGLPNSLKSQASFLMGDRLAEQGKSEEALKRYAFSDEIHPSPQAFFNHWRLLFEHGIQPAELEVLPELLEKRLSRVEDAEDRSRLLFERARYLSRIGDADRAESEMSRIEVAKLSSSEQLEYGLAYLELSRLSGGQMKIQTVGFENLDLPKESKDLLSLKTAESHYLNEEFNKAQRLFTQLSESLESESARQSALYFAAQAALKVGTPQASEEGSKMLETLMGEGALSGGMSRMACAAAARQALTDGQLQTALALVGKLEEAGKYYKKALTVYDRLEEQGLADKAPRWRYELSYLRGLCLERLDRLVEAQELYFDILNGVKKSVHAEGDWEAFYRVGFRLLYLLEKGEQWSAGAQVAKVMADYTDGAGEKGARAEEAVKRAVLLEKKDASSP